MLYQGEPYNVYSNLSWISDTNLAYFIEPGIQLFLAITEDVRQCSTEI